MAMRAQIAQPSGLVVSQPRGTSGRQHLNTGAWRSAETIGEWRRHRRQLESGAGQLPALSGEEREWDAAKLQDAK